MTLNHFLKVTPTLVQSFARDGYRAFFFFLLLTPLSFSGPLDFSQVPQANRTRSARRDQRIPVKPGGTLKVENPVGSIRIRTVLDSEARLNTIRPAALGQSEWYSMNSLDDPPGSVLVRIGPTAGEPLDVDITVPRTINLNLKTEKGAIEVIGSVLGLVAESQAGDIRVRLPTDHNADLALHSTNGTIRSELPTSIFGLFDSHHLQAKLGQGGSPILLRTMDGHVKVLPLEAPGAMLIATADPALPGNMSRTRSPSRPELRSADTAETESFGRSSPAERFTLPSDSAEVELEAPLVNLNVSVSDRAGRAIADLTLDDFSVFEDGVKQQIKHLSATTTPFDLVLLLDLSGSIEKKIKLVKQAAQRFVDFIGPDDRLAVYTFRKRVQVVSHLTNDRVLLKRRIDDMGGGQGGTGFYDALWFTLDELDQSSNKRKAIVVMTDGVDNSISHPEDSPSKHSFESLLERVEEVDMFIYPIYLDTEYEMVVQQRRENSEAYAVARRQLKELADRTASILFRAAQVEDLETVYQQVANELRTIYSLAYEPSNAARDGSWRRIEIKVNRPMVAVRTKHGYYAR